MLEIIVFNCGAIVMVLEILGSRIMAPYVGTSLFVWTTLIGVILFSISLGYYLGGNLADKYPYYKVMAYIIFITAILILFIGVSKDLVLLLLNDSGMGIRASAIVGSSILFVLPSILLGTISPYAVKFKMRNLTKSGNIVGRLYALSTLGSIIGTFLAGFYLIPTFGTTNILYLISFVLFITSLIAFKLSSIKITRLLILITIFLGLFFVSYKLSNFFTPKLLLDTDTPYSRVWVADVTEHNRPKRLLLRYLQSTESSIYLDTKELCDNYTKTYRFDYLFTPKINNALLIGGAGYTMATDFFSRNTTGLLDVVEIDPEMVKIATKYFFFDSENPKLNIYHQDARIFLNNTENKYDIIYSDAFNSGYSIPYQLATAEVVKKQYDILNENGIVMQNIISAVKGEHSVILGSIHKTFSKYFSKVYFIPNTERNPDEIQNIMIVAIKSKNGLKQNLTKTEKEFLANIQEQYTENIDVPLLTDDFTPLDIYASRML